MTSKVLEVFPSQKGQRVDLILSLSVLSSVIKLLRFCLRLKGQEAMKCVMILFGEWGFGIPIKGIE